MMGSKVILPRRLQPPLPGAACESWISSLKQPATSSRTGWIDNWKFWVGKVRYGIWLAVSESESESERVNDVDSN